MIILRSANNQHLVILGNIEILCRTCPQKVAHLVTLTDINQYNTETAADYLQQTFRVKIRHVQGGGGGPAPFPLDAQRALLSRQYFLFFFCN